MSHNLTELLATAVPEPPMVLEPGALLDAARQRQRQHRRVAVAGVLVCVAATATVGAFLLPTGGPSSSAPMVDAPTTPGTVTITADPSGLALQRRLTARVWVLSAFTAGGSTRAVAGRTVLQFGAHGFRIDGACEGEVGRVSYAGGRLVMTKGSQTGPDCPAGGADLSARALADLATGVVTIDGNTGGITLSGSGVTALFLGGPMLDHDLGVQLAPASVAAPVTSGIVRETIPSNVQEGPRIDWDARPNRSHVVTVQDLPKARGLTFAPVIPRFGVAPTRIDVATDPGQGASGGLVELHFAFPVSSAFPVDGRVVVREQPVASAPDGLAGLASGHAPQGQGTALQIAGHLSIVAPEQSAPGTFRVITVRGTALLTVGGPGLSRAEAVRLAGKL